MAAHLAERERTQVAERRATLMGTEAHVIVVGDDAGPSCRRRDRPPGAARSALEPLPPGQRDQPAEQQPRRPGARHAGDVPAHRSRARGVAADRRRVRSDDPRRPPRRGLRPQLRAPRCRRPVGTDGGERRAGAPAPPSGSTGRHPTFISIGPSGAFDSVRTPRSIPAGSARDSPPTSSSTELLSSGARGALVGIGGDLRAAGDTPEGGRLGRRDHRPARPGARDRNARTRGRCRRVELADQADMDRSRRSLTPSPHRSAHGPIGRDRRRRRHRRRGARLAGRGPRQGRVPRGSGRRAGADRACPELPESSSPTTEPCIRPATSRRSCST